MDRYALSHKWITDAHVFIVESTRIDAVVKWPSGGLLENDMRCTLSVHASAYSGTVNDMRRMSTAHSC